MSDTLMRVLFLFVDVILPLAVGYFFHKYKVITIDTCNFLLKLNVRIVVTVVGFGSFWLVKLDHNIFLLAFIGIVLCTALPGLMSYPYARRSMDNLADRGAYLIAVMLSNTGTLGGLCAYIAMGQLAYAYVQVVAMAQNIFTLTYCFPLAEYFRQKCEAGESKVKFNPHWKSILISWNQIGLIAMALGAVCNFYDVQKPMIFDPIFNSFVHIGAWLGILPVGYLLNFKAAKIYKVTTMSIVPIRFFLIPLLCYFTAQYFTDNPLLVIVATLMGLCPVGINSIVVTQLYKLNTNIAEANFLTTTFLFIAIAYPLFLLLML